MNTSQTNKNDWRVQTLSRLRQLIMSADPEITEKVKYKMPSNPDGIPVWYCHGMITTGETYQKHLRLSFTKGSKLRQHHDPKGIFNRHNAIVIHEGDQIDETAFVSLIRSAVALNKSG